MGKVFRNSRLTSVICWSISFTVIGFNIHLFINYLDELDWPLYAVVFSIIYFAFVLYLIYTPLEIPEKKEAEEIESEEEEEHL
jgi:membrane protein DedA with SNARE-associated domain